MSKVRLTLDPWRSHGPNAHPSGLTPDPDSIEHPRSVAGVEMPLNAWRAIQPPQNLPDPFLHIEFVDGVIRIDAHAHITTDGTHAPALLLSLGVGLTHHEDLRAEFLRTYVWRELRHAHPHPLDELVLPATRTTLGEIVYEPAEMPGADEHALYQKGLEGLRMAEAAVAYDVMAANADTLVIVDGPPQYRQERTLGVIKSTKHLPLPTSCLALVAALPQDARSPIYALDTPTGTWWEWIVALRDPARWGAPLAHVIRCRVQPSDVALAQGLANWTASRLPAFATSPGRDARAPQQLLPMAAIEREARRRMGDAGIIRRRLTKHLALRNQANSSGSSETS